MFKEKHKIFFRYFLNYIITLVLENSKVNIIFKKCLLTTL